jgi:hypothetical protein
MKLNRIVHSIFGLVVTFGFSSLPITRWVSELVQQSCSHHAEPEL